jgi:superfamily II DNA or RNA helicase
LRPEQERAAQALLTHDTGVLAAGTAFGKTVLAAWLIAARGVNTLVLVNRRQLQAQWVAGCHSSLAFPRRRSDGSGADTESSQEGWMSRCSKAWSAKRPWTTAWRFMGM